MIVNHINDLRVIAQTLGEEVLQISERVLLNPDFETWSGCVGNKHHYGKGGLQQHTWEVVTLCLNNRKFFEDLGHKISEKELFLAALFHDVGKIWDYKPSNEEMSEWEGTEHKRKIHHITRSAIYWSKSVSETGFCKDVEDEVLHAILSHHGQREWGSPVAPKDRVAWILHLCDSLSARIDDCDRMDVIHLK